LSLPVVWRFVVAVVLAFLPIMAANVIFAKRFASSLNPTSAFAANLLGAMVGGCLEYIALATGYRLLLIVCAILYLAAYVVMPLGRGEFRWRLERSSGIGAAEGDAGIARNLNDHA
jgi:hypothetical protein